MQFKEINIYGFGKWINKRIEFNLNALNVVYGFNEAGKSTIQNFLLFMLFDLPPREKKHYMPKKGHQFGGSLSFIHEAKEIKIERNMKETRLFEEGVDVSTKKEMSDYLSDISKESFLSIYSFSQMDLLAIREMKELDFRNVLFNAGLAGASTVEEIESDLEKERGEIFKKTGRVPRLNVQLEEIEALNEKLIQSEKELLTYKAYSEELAQVKEEISANKQAKLKIEEKRVENKAIQMNLPMIKRYKELYNQINSKELIEFKEDLMVSYTRLEEKVIPLENDINRLKSDLSVEEEKQSSLEEQLLSDQAYEKLTHFNSLYAKEFNEKENLYQRINAEKEAAVNKLRHLSHTSELMLTEDELRSLKLPYNTKSDWQEISKEELELQQSQQQMIEEEQALLDQIEILKADLDYSQALLLDKTQVETIKYRLERYEIIEEARMELKEKNKRAYLTLGISMTLFIAFLLVYSLTNELMFLIVGIAGVLASILFYGFSNTGKKHLLIGKERNLSELEKKSFETELEKHYREEKEIYAIKKSIKQVENQLEQAYLRQDKLTERLAEHQERCESVRSQYGFLSQIEPIYWGEIIPKLEQLIAEAERIKSLDEEEIRLKNEITHLNDLKETLLREHSVKHQEELVDLELKYSNLLQEKKFIENIIKNQKDALNKLEKELAIYLNEKQVLFEAVEVETDEVFHQKYLDYQTYKRESEELQTLRNQLEVHFSTHKLDVFHLVTYQETSLQTSLQALEKERDEGDEKQEKLNQKQAQIETKLEGLESSDRHSKRMHEYTFKREKILNDAKEYLAITAALSSLNKTKINYQAKYMDAVLEKASEYFKQMTQNKYTNITLDHKTTFLIHSQASVYNLEDLSQGTLDQLYTALRLAIGVTVKSTRNLPFIIDDAFVHFDEKRRARVLEILKDISPKMQVIYFTMNQRSLFDSHSIIDLNE